MNFMSSANVIESKSKIYRKLNYSILFRLVWPVHFTWTFDIAFYFVEETKKEKHCTIAVGIGILQEGKITLFLPK